MQHDIANRREEITDRLGHTTIHEYDLNGNVVKTTDALAASLSAPTTPSTANSPSPIPSAHHRKNLQRQR